MTLYEVSLTIISNILVKTDIVRVLSKFFNIFFFVVSSNAIKT